MQIIPTNDRLLGACYFLIKIDKQNSVHYNANSLIVAEEGDRMTYEITDECISCGVCLDECPVEAISEGEDKYEIDAELCTDCGSCADVCPVEAPIPVE